MIVVVVFTICLYTSSFCILKYYFFIYINWNSKISTYFYLNLRRRANFFIKKFYNKTKNKTITKNHYNNYNYDNSIDRSGRSHSIIISVQNQSKSGNPALYNLTCNNKPFDDGLHIYTTNVKRKEGKN